jgi:hypothetical protein
VRETNRYAVQEVDENGKPRGGEVGKTNHARVESISWRLSTYGNEETTKYEDVLAKRGVFFSLSSYIGKLHP